MRDCDRRTFLKCSATLAAAAAGQTLVNPIMARAAINPAPAYPLGTLSPEDSVARSSTDEKAFHTLSQDAASRRGANHPFFVQGKNRPEVIAHRGGAGQWPGETLYAYEQAVKIGVDILELDIHSTRDGHMVLMHNKTVDDTTNGRDAVRSFTLEELKRLDAGYRWTADGGESFPFRNKGIKVATLKEVFETFPQMRMNIEIKQSEPSLVEPFCKMIRDHKMADKVLVASFWDKVLKEFRRQCPDVATSASTEELLAFNARNNSLIGGSYRPDTDALQMKDKVLAHRVITKRYVDKAHRLNLQVHAWTVNDLDEMQRMIALGVDGIITDYPGPLLSLLARIRPL